MNVQERMHYIAAVALLVRLHNTIPRKAREAFDSDGDPFVRLAADFNGYGFNVRLVPNGQTWMLETAERPAHTVLAIAGEEIELANPGVSPGGWR